MFRFVKKVLTVATTFFGCIVLKYALMNNQECKIRPQVANINSDNRFYYPYSIEVNQRSDSFNNINDPYSILCVPNVVKNINVKVFNLVSRTNEIRHTE